MYCHVNICLGPRLLGIEFGQPDQSQNMLPLKYLCLLHDESWEMGMQIFELFSAGRQKYWRRDWKHPTKKLDGCCHSTFSVQSVKLLIIRHQIWSKVQSTDTSNLVRTKRKVRTVVRAIFKGEVAARALSPRINSSKASLSACGPAAKATNDANKCQDIKSPS